MDLKHSPRLSRAAGIDAPAAADEKASYLMHGKTPYEFRTTLVKGLHTPGDVERIAGWIAGIPYFLQSYADSGDILSPGGLDAFLKELQQMLQLARKHCPEAALRGILEKTVLRFPKMCRIPHYCPIYCATIEAQ
ncbi:MAG: hypothetical protein ACLVF4_11305 [Ruminococcus sp.]